MAVDARRPVPRPRAGRRQLAGLARRAHPGRAPRRRRRWATGASSAATTSTSAVVPGRTGPSSARSRSTPATSRCSTRSRARRPPGTSGATWSTAANAGGSSTGRSACSDRRRGPLLECAPCDEAVGWGAQPASAPSRPRSGWPWRRRPMRSRPVPVTTTCRSASRSRCGPPTCRATPRSSSPTAAASGPAVS